MMKRVNVPLWALFGGLAIAATSGGLGVYWLRPAPPSAPPVVEPPVKTEGVSSQEVDAQLERELTQIVADNVPITEIIGRCSLWPYFVSDLGRSQFFARDLSEEPTRPTPIERIEKYDDLVVWIRPDTKDRHGVIKFVGIGWMGDKCEVFFCRHVPRQ